MLFICTIILFSIISSNSYQTKETKDNRLVLYLKSSMTLYCIQQQNF